MITRGTVTLSLQQCISLNKPQSCALWHKWANTCSHSFILQPSFLVCSLLANYRTYTTADGMIYNRIVSLWMCYWLIIFLKTLFHNFPVCLLSRGSLLQRWVTSLLTSGAVRASYSQMALKHKERIMLLLHPSISSNCNAKKCLTR